MQKASHHDDASVASCASEKPPSTPSQTEIASPRIPAPLYSGMVPDSAFTPPCSPQASINGTAANSLNSSMSELTAAGGGGGKVRASSSSVGNTADNWFIHRLTCLLVDVRDTIANRLMENDEYVADTDEYFLKLKNRLYHNDERRFESLHLHLHPSNPPLLEKSLHELKAACQSDATVRHLTFRIGMFEPEPGATGLTAARRSISNNAHQNQSQTAPNRRWTKEEMQLLSQAILSMSKLEKVECCYYLQEGLDLMPVQDLISGMRLKQHPESRLQCLELHHLHLLSEQDGNHINDLAKSLQGNSILRQFRLGTISSCFVKKVALDELIQSLATLPNLQQFHFIDQALNPFCLGGVTCQASTFAAFLRRTASLQSVKINEESFDWDDEAIVSMVRVLHGNRILKTFELRRDIGQYLRSLGPSSLRSLGLAGRGTRVTSRAYNFLVEMLEENYTLEELFVYGNGKGNSRNTSSASTTAFAHTNQSTRANNGGKDETDYERQVDFLLKLNRDGRRHLMEHEHTHEWVEAVIAHRDELDKLFYVLSNNPSVILMLLKSKKSFQL